MEKEIVVTLVLDDKLAAQFQTASKLVVTESGKMSKSVEAVTESANTSAVKMGQSLGRYSGAMQSFAQNVIQGDVMGAFRSLTSIGIAGMKALTVQTALATGGITLALGAIALIVSKIRTEHAESKRLQDELKTEQERMVAIDLDLKKTAIEREKAVVSAKYEADIAAKKEFYKKNNEADKDAWGKEEYTLENQGQIILGLASAQKEEIKRLKEREKEELAEIDKKYADKAKVVTDKTNRQIVQDQKADIAELKEYFTKIRAIREDAEKKELEGSKKIMDLKQDKMDAESEAFAINAAYRVKQFEAMQQAEIANVEAVGNIIGILGDVNTALKGSAEFSRNLAIGETIVNTAVAIMKVTAQTGILSPFAIPLIVARGVAQLAVISAQKFALGGDFVTSGPRLIMVGDNPGGRERVSVTPMSSPNINGPGGQTINMGNVYISGNADASTVRALGKSREKQLKDLRGMLLELSYARQMPRLVA